MRKYLLMTAILLMPMLCLAQAAGGQVTRPAKTQTTTTTTKSGKKQTQEKEQTSKPIEPSGYDVSFSCNVSSATLYIDGTLCGLVGEPRFLKTGQHSIMLEASGYETINSSIEVNSTHTSFSFTMREDIQQQIIIKISNNIINNMVRVEGGTFTMGATNEENADSDEKPAHQVTLSSFYIGKYEVTQEEWEAVMGSNPSHFKGTKRPVESVSWDDCQEFIRILNTKTGNHFRLPTEAEWEYAARGGNIKTTRSGSKLSHSVGVRVWNTNNSGGTTHDVGQNKANPLGLYDMIGNVWEWCSDWYGSYNNSSQTNPAGPASGNSRVIRGGSWNNDARICRISNRNSLEPTIRKNYLGFRLAL